MNAAATRALVALALGGALMACHTPDASKNSSGSASANEVAGKTKHSTEDLKELSADQVDQRIAANDGKFFVFDANDKGVFDGGHVPTAKWVPFEAVTADMLPADKKAELVFYCANEH